MKTVDLNNERFDLLMALADRLPQYSRTEIRGVLQQAVDIIEYRLCRELVTNVPGIGKFVTKVKPARSGRVGINPKTKEAITIAPKPASKQVRLRLASNLKKLFDSQKS